MTRNTVAILFAVIAAVCAVLVLMDVRSTTEVLAGGLLAVAVAVVVAVAP